MVNRLQMRKKLDIIDVLKSFFRDTRVVFIRELKQMFSRPVYIFGTVGTIVFCCIFFSTLMYQGLPMKVPVGIVDNDHSSLSRRFVREFNANPGITVYKQYNSHREARMEMQEGKIFGFVEVPENMYSDILSNRRPNIAVYVTESFMVPGTLAYKSFLQLSNLASGAIQREFLRARGKSEHEIMGLIQPIVVDSHYVENPWSNYGVYLIDVILPGILQLVIILMTVFAIGYELKMKTTRKWIVAAGLSFPAAFTGKLLPYTILYLALGFGLEIFMYKVLNYPLSAPLYLMMINMFLMVIASEAVGVFMIGLFPVLRDGLSFASIYSILSLSIAGMTFPLENMWPPFSALGQLFPLRHYFLIYVHSGLYGGGFETCWIHYVVLLLFLFLPVLVLKRLSKAMVYQNYPLK